MTKTISSPGKPSSRTRATNKASTRRAILRVAEDLFASQGYEETRADDIAKKAGVAVGTIYLHFGDKEGLLKEILLEGTEELRQGIAKCYQSGSHEMQPLLRAQVQTIVNYIEEHKKISSFVLNAILGGHPVARTVLERAVGQVENSIRQAQVAGGCRDDIDPQLVARAEVQMYLGLLAWWAKDTRRATREGIIDTISKILSAGMQTSN